jgi:hypothetical protein
MPAVGHDTTEKKYYLAKFTDIYKICSKLFFVWEVFDEFWTKFEIGMTILCDIFASIVKISEKGKQCYLPVFCPTEKKMLAATH